MADVAEQQQQQQQAASAEASTTESYVRLISAEGLEFVLDRKYAMVSSTIRNMLSSPGNFTESMENEIHFRDIKAVVLERVCQYLIYKVRHTRSAAMGSEIPEFPIEPELSLELLMAADFLDC